MCALYNVQPQTLWEVSEYLLKLNINVIPIGCNCNCSKGNGYFDSRPLGLTAFSSLNLSPEFYMEANVLWSTLIQAVDRKAIAQSVVLCFFQ